MPGFYSPSYNHKTCPPTSLYAAYNVISSPKRLLLALEWGQSTTPEQDERIQAWVLDPSGVR